MLFWEFFDDYDMEWNGKNWLSEIWKLLDSLKLFLLREKIVIFIKISVIYVWLYKIKKKIKENKNKNSFIL